jgi:hypothetical protein
MVPMGYKNKTEYKIDETKRASQVHPPSKMGFIPLVRMSRNLIFSPIPPKAMATKNLYPFEKKGIKICV